MSDALRTGATRDRAAGPVARAVRFLSRISVRLLAFNLLVVFLPAAGVLFLDTYEDHLLRAQERTMAQEGRLLAAALQAQGELDPPYARAILIQLGQRHLARLRILDREGRVIADSAALGPRRDPVLSDDAETPTAEIAPTTGIQANPLYRLASIPFRMLRESTSEQRPAAAVAPDDPSSWPEVRGALAGRYGASTRIRDDDSPVVLLFIAIPIRIGGSVEGAVLVSQSTTRILNALYAVRFDVLKVFLASLGAAVVLSLVVATTIARPLGRLRRRAEAILDRRGRLKGGFEPSRRADEIGDLERALAELTRRLEEHLRFSDRTGPHTGRR
ncbi:MAG: sensor N-terminal transmembrane domain-containing protein [Trueperaceae bacterium]